MSEPILIGEVIKDILEDLRGDVAELGERVDDSHEELKRLRKEVKELREEANRTEVLTPGLSARYTGKTLQTLRNYSKRGVLSKVTVDGITGYRKSDLKRIFHI